MEALIPGISEGWRLDRGHPPLNPTHPPAIALGSGVTLLGVTRILGRQGLPMRVSVSETDFVASSRWLPRDARLPAIGPGVDLPEYLAKLPLDGGVLIPCSDELALAVAELPADLAKRFPSYQPDAAVLRLLVDKGEFLGALVGADIPHPRTHLVERADDLDGIGDDELRFAFVKPRDSQRFQREYGVKGLHAKGREDLRDVLSELLAKGHRLMVQEYVPGPASNHYFIDGFMLEGDDTLTLLARQRLRMYPVDFGNSTFMVSVPPDEVAGAVESLRRLLRSLGYRGIFSAEFKRDSRDGVFRIIEINARPWWYVEFAARAGFDVVKLAYRAALGLPLDPPVGYQIGKTMMYPYYDYPACRALTSGTGSRAAAVPDRPRGRGSTRVLLGRSGPVGPALGSTDAGDRGPASPRPPRRGVALRSADTMGASYSCGLLPEARHDEWTRFVEQAPFG